MSMYLVDEQVMQFALGKLDNLRTFGILYPSMEVVEMQSIEEEYQRHRKKQIMSIVGAEQHEHEVYSRDHSEHTVVQLNKDLGVLEAYYPYKLQTRRDI